MTLRLKGRTIEEAYVNECHQLKKEVEFLEKDNKKLRNMCESLMEDNAELNEKLKEVKAFLGMSQWDMMAE